MVHGGASVCMYVFVCGLVSVWENLQPLSSVTVTKVGKV